MSVIVKNKLLIAFTAAIFLVAIAGRLVFHAPNATPMGAFALFVGAYLGSKNKWLLFLPLAAMAISDLFVGSYDWKLMAVVYASFLVYGVVGMLAAKRKNPGTLFLATIAGSLLFYLVTNAAVWILSPWYTHNLQGLLLSYTLALPFFRATLFGDIVFTAIFIGGYEFFLGVYERRFFWLSYAKNRKRLAHQEKLV
jgi:hypothetical protein